MAFYCDYSFAQAKKDIIAISTYYPSPYGSYNEVSIEEGVQFQTVNPIQGNLTCDNTKEGKLVYGKLLGTETKSEFYICDGLSWKKFSSSSSQDVTIISTFGGDSCTAKCESGQTMIKSACASIYSGTPSLSDRLALKYLNLETDWLYWDGGIPYTFVRELVYYSGTTTPCTVQIPMSDINSTCLALCNKS